MAKSKNSYRLMDVQTDIHMDVWTDILKSLFDFDALLGHIIKNINILIWALKFIQKS